MHGFQTSAFKKIHKHLAQGLGTLITSCTGKRRSAHQKNKPIVTQFVHVRFARSKLGSEFHSELTFKL